MENEKIQREKTNCDTDTVKAQARRVRESATYEN